MPYNLLLELLFGVVESLHTLRTADCRLGFDVAESILAVESCKAYARKVHKLGVAVLASDSVSHSHSYIILRFCLTFTMQRYGAILTISVKV